MKVIALLLALCLGSAGCTMTRPLDGRTDPLVAIKRDELVAAPCFTIRPLDVTNSVVDGAKAPQSVRVTAFARSFEAGFSKRLAVGTGENGTCPFTVVPELVSLGSVSSGGADLIRERVKATQAQLDRDYGIGNDPSRNKVIDGTTYASLSQANLMSGTLAAYSFQTVAVNVVLHTFRADGTPAADILYQRPMAKGSVVSEETVADVFGRYAAIELSTAFNALVAP